VLRATGVDVLGLDLDNAGRGVEPGPVTFISYEDADSIIVSRLKHILHHHYARIERASGTPAARCVLRAIRQALPPHPPHRPAGCALVVRKRTRPARCATPRRVNALEAALRSHAASEHLTIIDPLRLAFRGSQNDDDGADLAVMVLNDSPRGCGLGAAGLLAHDEGDGREGGSNRVALAYATAGSGLYSQHARSNFPHGPPGAGRADAARASRRADAGGSRAAAGDGTHPCAAEPTTPRAGRFNSRCVVGVLIRLDRPSRRPGWTCSRPRGRR